MRKLLALNVVVAAALISSCNQQLSTDTAQASVKKKDETQNAAPQTERAVKTEPATLPLTVTLSTVPSFDACGIYAKYDGAASPAKCVTEFRSKGESSWHAAFPLVHAAKEKLFKGSIVYLAENKDYEVRVTLRDDKETVCGSAAQSFKTWSSLVPVAKTIQVRDVPKGPLRVAEVKGTAEGWIKYVGDGETVIDGGESGDAAVLVSKSSFIIFEGITVRGGKRYGFDVAGSNDIRIVNCDIAGFGRVGKQDFTKDGKFFDEHGKDINYDPGVFINLSANVVVERCYIHDPRSTANSWRYSHPAGPEAMLIRSLGGAVVRYNDFIGSDLHRWNDVIEGYDNGSVAGGFRRDADIYGNMLCLANDDGIEMDGGQMNIRFHHNRIAWTLCAVSVAPCMLGPSYVFNNLAAELGDEEGTIGVAIKSGGGDTYSHGRTHVLNNTFDTGGGGLGGAGYGTDKNRAMFKCYSRNNIVRTNGPSSVYDKEKFAENDFDYDMVSNSADPANLFVVAEGQEAHGIKAPPVFRNAAAGDYRLADASRGRGEGIMVENFSTPDSDGKVSMGAYGGNVGFLPFRPIPLVPDKTRVELAADLRSGSLATEKVTISVKAGAPWTRKFRVMKNDAFDWLAVEPPAGEFKEGESVVFTVGIDKAKATPGVKRGVFLVRLDDGFSVPVTCRAVVHGGGFEKRFAAAELPGASAFKLETDPEAVGGKSVALDGQSDAPDRKCLTAEIEIPADGAYFLFVRIKCPTPVGSHDSLFLSLDNGGYDKNDLLGSPAWHWAPLAPNGGGVPGRPKFAFNLTKGTHTFRLAPRESLLVDGFVVTVDPVPPER